MLQITSASWPGGGAQHFVSPAAERAFRSDEHLVGIALGTPHDAAFGFGGDRLRRYRMLPGDIQLVPAGVAHAVRWEACEFGMLSIAPAFVEQVTEGRFSVLWTGEPCIKLRDPLVEALVRGLVAEAQAPPRRSPGRGILRETLTAALVAQLRYGRPMLPPLTPGRARRQLGALRIQRALEYVEEHLREDLSLSRLCAELGISPFHFSRQFKAATGVSPHRYVTQRRLQRAEELLARANADPDAVAAAVGFAGATQLRAAFRRIRGTQALAWPRTR